MFERFNERARRSIFFARYEASQAGSAFIETQHLLLGLLRESSDIRRLFPNLEEIRKRIEEEAPSKPKTSTSIDLPLSRECKMALAWAAEFSLNSKHPRIESGHLFVGLLRAKDSLAARIMHELGIGQEEITRLAFPKPQGELEPAGFRLEQNDGVLTALCNSCQMSAAIVYLGLEDELVRVKSQCPACGKQAIWIISGAEGFPPSASP